MPCNDCKHLKNIKDLTGPYVIRTCPSCSRKIKLREPGKNGHGIQVNKGDQFVVPKGWLNISANPLKGTGHLTKHGLEWFAKLIFVEELKKEKDFDEFTNSMETQCDKILRSSALLSDLDIDSEADAEELFDRLKSNQSTAEWWAFIAGTFNAIARDAVDEDNAKKAAWAMRAAERCRAMFIFKENLEEVVWMGHSARRIVDVIRKWHSNKTNDNEEFWQQVFKENPYVLTQVFSVPVVFIGDKAYVGGMGIDQKDSKFVDYLYANESSGDTVLVELKTPVTKLLGSKYRKGVHKPSAELSGAIVQTLDYRRELARNIVHLAEKSPHKIDMFSPRCILVAGNAEAELNDEIKMKSFELFRSSLRNIEIVTFDELFRKAESIATLFSLKWNKGESYRDRE